MPRGVASPSGSGTGVFSWHASFASFLWATVWSATTGNGDEFLWRSSGSWHRETPGWSISRQSWLKIRIPYLAHPGERNWDGDHERLRGGKIVRRVAACGPAGRRADPAGPCHALRDECAGDQRP